MKELLGKKYYLLFKLIFESLWLHEMDEFLFRVVLEKFWYQRIGEKVLLFSLNRHPCRCEEFISMRRAVLCWLMGRGWFVYLSKIKNTGSKLNEAFERN